MWLFCITFAPEKSGSPPPLCSHFHSLCLGCCSHCSPSPIATFPNDKQHFPPCDSPSKNHTCHLYVEWNGEWNRSKCCNQPRDYGCRTTDTAPISLCLATWDYRYITCHGCKMSRLGCEKLHAVETRGWHDCWSESADDSTCPLTNEHECASMQGKHSSIAYIHPTVVTLMHAAGVCMSPGPTKLDIESVVFWLLL